MSISILPSLRGNIKKEMEYIPNKITKLTFCYQTTDNINNLILKNSGRVEMGWKFHSYDGYMPESVRLVEFMLKSTDFSKSIIFIKKDDLFISDIDYIRPTSRNIKISFSKSLNGESTSLSFRKC